MKQKIEFYIEEELIKKFKISLLLSNEDENTLAEEWIQKYVQKVFLKEIGNEEKEEKSDNNTINKIRKWVNKVNNMPHLLIKAFFLCYDEESVSASKSQMLDVFLSNYEITNKETYEQLRKKFIDNYSQMKSNGAHAHGNVFYDDGVNVFLVSDVKNEILKLKDKFII